MESEPASETSCILKVLDGGQSEKNKRRLSESHPSSSKSYKFEYLFRYVKAKLRKKTQYQGYLHANVLCGA